jgi:PPK2 family polyphosphate:nucleotide phosphotransferase
VAKSKKGKNAAPTVPELLRVGGGPVDLSSIDPRATTGFDGNKVDGKAALPELAPEMDQLQERLFAHGRTGGHKRLLLVVQGMDTSGKGGTMRHAVGLMDPQGVRIKAFKAPTPEEKRRGFLWRIKQELPGPGFVGVFDRSHYEDVLIGRVRKLATEATIERRYDSINAFESELADSGCTIVKVMLHISEQEQKERLLERVENPAKYWKYNPADVNERERWPEYQRAYEIALERCNTTNAPWFVVPADRKWYRNWAVTTLLIEHLQTLDLDWPEADFDVEAERKRVAAS